MKAKSKNKSGAGLKGFFIYHGEKLLVVAFVLLALWMAFSGLTGYKPLAWQPQELVQAANQADEHIKNSKVTPREIDDKLFIVPYDDKATWIKKDVNSVAFVTDKKWEPTLFPDKFKREVPTIYAVESLRAIPGCGPILSIDRTPKPTGAAAGRMGGMTGGMTGGADMMGGMGGTSGTKLVAKKWIVLTGLIPIKKQLSHYLSKFSESMFTSPMIDTPQFLAYQIERSEYDPANPGKLDWKKIDAVRQYTTELNDWAGMGSEQVDRSYLAPMMSGTVPMAYPLPPMPTKLYGEEIAYPPYVPLLSDSLVESMEKQEALLEKYKEFKPVDEAQLIEMRTKGGMGMPGGGMGMPGGGMGMTGGGMGMTGGGMGMSGGGMGMSGGGMGMSGGGMGMTGGGMGMSGGGMGMTGGGMGMTGGGMGMGTRRGVNPTGIMAEQDVYEYEPPSLVDYYLFRFFDFDISDEKSYVYRVKLIALNPNFKLNPKYLEDENSNKDPVLYSEFSAPSQPMSAGRMSRVLVKEVIGPATKRAYQETYARLLPIYFDLDDANEWVSNDEKPVYPGMVANFRSTSCFNSGSSRTQTGGLGGMGPGGGSGGTLGGGRGTAGAKKGPENKTVDIVSDVCFLGSYGGFLVEGSDRSPAKVLLMDANGTVMLRDLGKDLDESQKYTKTPTGPRGGMGGMGGMSGGMGSGGSR